MEMLLFFAYEVISSIIPLCAVLFVFSSVRRKKQIPITSRNLLALLIFSCYTIGIHYFTGAGTLYDGFLYQLEFRKNQVNLIPFSKEIDIIGYFLNIILFVPFGFLTPMIWKKRDHPIHVIGSSFLYSILIEGSQLLNNRSTDIDDIIMNLIGAMVGFGIYRIWDKITTFRHLSDEDNLLELPMCILVSFFGRFFLFNEMGLAKLLYCL